MRRWNGSSTTRWHVPGQTEILASPFDFDQGNRRQRTRDSSTRLRLVAIQIGSDDRLACHRNSVAAWIGSWSIPILEILDRANRQQQPCSYDGLNRRYREWEVAELRKFDGCSKYPVYAELDTSILDRFSGEHSPSFLVQMGVRRSPPQNRKVR